MAEVISEPERAIRQLQEIPEGQHLCCPKISDDDDESYEDREAPSNITAAEKEQRVREGNERLHLTYSSSLILGVERDAAGTWLQEFVQRSSAFLTSCASCARNWHKHRRAFLQEVVEKYADNAVGEFEDRLNLFDFARITEGLAAAKDFILNHDGVVSQSTFVKEDKIELLVALYEAICCMPYLSLPENRQHFNFVFEKIQERKVLRLDEILPTMTFFLFDENPVRHKFAVHILERKPRITESDFEWAVRGNLEKEILKANDPNPDYGFLQRFWQGILLILEALDEGLIANSLRSMTIQPSIFDLLINQLPQIDSSAILRLLIKTFCCFIQKSPRSFWDAYSQYPAPAVLEQVIRNPAFLRLLGQAGEHDSTPAGPTAISWVRPFVDSISTNQKTDVCDKVLHHLIGDFASTRDLSQEAQFACYRGATEALSSSLTAFMSSRYKLRAGSSTIHTNTLLNLTLKHNDVVVQVAQHPRPDLSQVGLSVITLALTLDSRITAEEFSAVQDSDDHIQREITRDSAGLWEAFLESLQPKAYALARAMLLGATPLNTVEILRPLKKQSLSPVKSRLNAEFQKATEAVGRMIDRLEDFDRTSQQRLVVDPPVALTIVGSLIHGEEPISEAGASFIKSYTEESRRTGAVLKLLQMHFITMLNAFTRVTDKVTSKRGLWSPQFNILRYSGEILNSLCDPSSGILRAKDLNSAEQEVLGSWWNSQWQFLNNAFNQTDGWSQMIEMTTMKNFCREAMEHADALLAQDGLLASAMSPDTAHSTALSHSGDASRQAMKDILKQPRENSMGLCRMLRLKDLYLVDVVVNVLGKLLRRLVEYDIEIPSEPLSFIRKTCIKTAFNKYAISTNMSETQKAELARALGEEEDAIEIVSVKKVEAPKKQTKLDTWSKSVEETSNAISSAPAKEKPKVTSRKDDVRELLKASSSDKARPGLDPSRARPRAKQMPPAPPVSSIPSIREKRAREAEEKRKRDAQAVAKARALRAPKPIVAGEGSGLQGLSGVQGKDHAPLRSEIMVNSSSEDEDDSEDDAEFLKRTGTGKKPGDDESKRIQDIKQNPRLPVKKVKIQRSAKDMRARLIPPMDNLHQAILEWDIFHEGNDPPNSSECSRVSDTYQDPREYKTTFFPLLINEAWRSFVTAKDEATTKPFGIKVVNRMNVDKFIEVSTAMPISERKDQFLGEGDIVLFSHASTPLEARDELHCLARIWRVQFKNGSLEVQYRLSGRAGPILSTLMPGAELFAIKVTNMTTIEREYASLESLQYYDLAIEILEAKPSPMLKFSPEAVEKTMQNYHLNAGQAKAIMNAKANEAFTLVQGPPGTGKTKTIVAMVGSLLTGNFASNNGTAIKRPNGPSPAGSKGTSKKLLVCAPSNAAVDELVLRLKAGVKSSTGSFHKINVVRLGRTDVINAAVKDCTLDELVKARVEGDANQKRGPSSREMMHQEAGQIKSQLGELRPQLEAARTTGDRPLTSQLQRKFDELKRRQAQIGAKIDADKDSGNTAARENEIRRRQIQQEILDSAQVLCATLSGSGHEMFKNLAVEFETVIIDEAAQCVELSALIPLKYGCSRCILVGDPKQLPPTVLSQSAARYGYDQSLFVRMQRNCPDDVHLLDTQYRMHPEISMFPSQEFYERRLVDGDDMSSLRHQPWHRSALLGPYRFFDVKGAQEKGRRGQSLVNMQEIKVAMQLYERFLTDYPEIDVKAKIGMITPYKAQLFELREQFARRYGNSITEQIEFNTTDAFQGRECEIIIFSCVRASSTGGIGFMTDIRRMNVGLTRAKSSLWILGDSRALVQGEFWNKLIVDAKARDRYTAGDVIAQLRQPGAKHAPSRPSYPALETAPAAMNSGNQRPHPPKPTDNRASANVPPHPTRVNGDGDVEMTDAPGVDQPVPLRHRAAQLPPAYPASRRNSSNFQTNNQSSPGFAGLNERGEPATVLRSASERPIIHPSGKKRPRGDSGDDGNMPKRGSSGPPRAPPRAPPSAPRAMPRPQDPSAMSVLGLEPSTSSSAGRPPPSRPQNAPRGPSNPQLPPRPPPTGPRKKAPSSDPFIRRKPNRPGPR